MEVLRFNVFEFLLPHKVTKGDKNAILNFTPAGTGKERQEDTAAAELLQPQW